VVEAPTSKRSKKQKVAEDASDSATGAAFCEEVAAAVKAANDLSW
jgi:hypothetical protein